MSTYKNSRTENAVQCARLHKSRICREQFDVWDKSRGNTMTNPYENVLLHYSPLLWRLCMCGYLVSVRLAAACISIINNIFRWREISWWKYCGIILIEISLHCVEFHVYFIRWIRYVLAYSFWFISCVESKFRFGPKRKFTRNVIQWIEKSMELFTTRNYFICMQWFCMRKWNTSLRNHFISPRKNTFV